MRKLTNLNGVKTLNKKEQKSISGGAIIDRCQFVYCTWRCVNGKCIAFNEM